MPGVYSKGKKSVVEDLDNLTADYTQCQRTGMCANIFIQRD